MSTAAQEGGAPVAGEPLISPPPSHAGFTEVKSRKNCKSSLASGPGARAPLVLAVPLGEGALDEGGLDEGGLDEGAVPFAGAVAGHTGAPC